MRDCTDWTCTQGQALDSRGLQCPFDHCDLEAEYVPDCPGRQVDGNPTGHLHFSDLAQPSGMAGMTDRTGRTLLPGAQGFFQALKAV